MNVKEAREAQAIAKGNMDAAAAKLRRVSNPTSVAAASAAFTLAQNAYEEAVADTTEARRNELRELDNEALIKRHAGNANFSYEANMGDYSIGSIHRAADELGDSRTVLLERGIDAQASIVWETGTSYARWVPAKEIPYLTADQIVIAKATAILGRQFTVAPHAVGNRAVSVNEQGVSMSAEAFEALLALVSA